MSVAQLIRDWFQSEKHNCGHQRLAELSNDVDNAVANMPRPLTQAAAAWALWMEWENTACRNDPGLYRAMDLCAYAEWSADRELGLTDAEFSGVPRLVISVSGARE